MEDDETNDFTFCKVDLQTDIGFAESPLKIPDINKITLEDTCIKDSNSIDSLEDNSLLKKFTSSSGFPYVSSESQALKSNGRNGDLFIGLEGQKPALKKAVVRGKVPFEKGYSPMDWLKLTQTHFDLAGLKGQTNRRLVTMDEVKKHKAEGSVWTVLKGRVYNVSPYMKFHPGGIDMMMKAAGKDCTSLFNKYHAWVNAEFLLEKCLVGVLDNST